MTPPNTALLPTEIIRVEHECLDAAMIEEFGDPVASLPANHNVILDFSKVRFADSSGLGFLVKLQRTYADRIFIRNLHDRFRRCLTRVKSSDIPPEIHADDRCLSEPESQYANQGDVTDKTAAKSDVSIHEAIDLPFNTTHESRQCPNQPAINRSIRTRRLLTSSSLGKASKINGRWSLVR